MQHRQIIGYRKNGAPIRLIQGASEPTPEPTPSTGTTPEPTWTPPASQADLDKIIADRLTRDRAKYSDHAALKKKANQWDELEAKSRTDLENANAKAEAEKARADAAELRATRADVAAEKGVPSNLLAGTTKEELEASADALLAFRGQARPATSSTVTSLAPGQEKRKTAGEEGRAEAARRFQKAQQ